MDKNIIIRIDYRWCFPKITGTMIVSIASDTNQSITNATENSDYASFDIDIDMSHGSYYEKAIRVYSPEQEYLCEGKFSSRGKLPEIIPLEEICEKKLYSNMQLRSISKFLLSAASFAVQHFIRPITTYERTKEEFTINSAISKKGIANIVEIVTYEP